MFEVDSTVKTNLAHLLNTTCMSGPDSLTRWLYTVNEVYAFVESVCSAIRGTCRCVAIDHMSVKTKYRFSQDAYSELKEVFLFAQTEQQQIIAAKKHGAALVGVALPTLLWLEKQYGHAAALVLVDMVEHQLKSLIDVWTPPSDTFQVSVSYAIMEQLREANRDGLCIKAVMPAA